MIVENLPVDQVLPYPHNPRKILPEAIDAVAESIRNYGWKQPIVVDRNNVIIVGHTRLLAAKQLGLTEVPCVRATNLTDDQVREYRIIDNKSGEKAIWNFELLQGELKVLNMSKDVFRLNFSSLELDTIFDANWDTDLGETESEPTPEPTSAKFVLECKQVDQSILEAWLQNEIQNSGLKVALV